MLLRKIVLMIGALSLAGTLWAEDAPLPFDDPSAAPPIARKAEPATQVRTAAQLPSSAKTKKAYAKNKKSIKANSNRGSVSKKHAKTSLKVAALANKKGSAVKGKQIKGKQKATNKKSAKTSKKR